MYKGLRKVILLVLCITLIGGNTLVYAKNAKPFTAEGVPGAGLTQVNETYVNEAYEGIFDEEVEFATQDASLIDKRSTPKFETTDEASAYIHEQLLKRSTYISFTVNQVFIFGMSSDLFQKAIEYKEGMGGNDGDYLVAHFRGYSCNMSYAGTMPGVTFTYTMKYLESYENEVLVDKEVKRVLDELNVYDQNEYIKARAVHDWMVENIEYDYSLEKYSAYNAIVERSVVCQGFASLTYRLLKDLGLDVRYITGNPRTNGTDGHAWNIVKIGDKWYNVDNTWDENISFGETIGETYFLKNETDFYAHTRNAKYMTAEFNAAYPMSDVSYRYETGITLNYETIELEVTDSKKLYAWAYPGKQTLIFESSNPEVASVDQEGNITALNSGTAVITVTNQAGTSTSTCEAVVKEGVKVTELTLNKKTMSLAVGKSERLVAKVSPEDAVNKTVLFESSNKKVATVNESGMITAVAAGKTTITASAEDGTITAVCEVTVVQPVTTVTLSKTSLSLKKGQTYTVTATVAPQNASNKAVTYTSSNTKVATVTKDGKVSAVGKGTATITVKTADGAKVSTCKVTVTIPVTSVSLDKKAVTLNKGSSVKVTAKVNPGDASNKAVTFTSSNKNIAKVDYNGKITAVKTGTATITVKTKDGGKTASCKVTVVSKVKSVSLNKTKVTVKKGKSVKITATINPGDATNKKVTFTSKNSKIAKVDKNGKITGVKKGTTTVTVTTSDGNKKATCKVTVK